MKSRCFTLSAWLWVACGSEHQGDDHGRTADAGARQATSMDLASDGGPGSGQAAPNGEAAGTTGAPAPTNTAPETADAEPEAACEVPNDCLALTTAFYDFEPCCRPGQPCGYEFVGSEELRELFYEDLFSVSTATECIPDNWVFGELPGATNERVQGADGHSILLSSECEGRSILNMPLPGCCLPDNSCGVSTYQTYDTLAELLVDGEAAFTQLECVLVAEMNAQLKATHLAGFGRLQPHNHGCDYAALLAEVSAEESVNMAMAETNQEPDAGAPSP